MLTAREIAQRLNVKPQTVRYWRMVGKGPRWVKTDTGSIRYDIADLAAYEQSLERGAQA